MAERMKDGEIREVRASAEWSMFKNENIKVKAERYDCDTPYVHLTVANETWDPEKDRLVRTEFTHVMTDVETEDLINRLQRAIKLLPSSK